MTHKNLSDYKRKYDVARHHAWAGSVLLAVLLAIRIFLETTDIIIIDWLFFILGFILVIYTLVAVFFTYKYRSGLSAEQKNVVEVQIKSDKLEKEKIKLQKKKAKAEAKKDKKSSKK